MRPNGTLTFSFCHCLVAQVGCSLQLIHYPCVWESIVYQGSFHAGCCCCWVTGVDLKCQLVPLKKPFPEKMNKYERFPNIQMRQGSDISIQRQWIQKRMCKIRWVVASSYKVSVSYLSYKDAAQSALQQRGYKLQHYSRIIHGFYPWSKNSGTFRGLVSEWTKS